MIRILLCGCNGTMGKNITSMASKQPDLEIVAGIDRVLDMPGHYPVFSSIQDYKGPADVIVDFSHPSLLSDVLTFAVNNKIPLVEATTGLSEQQTGAVKTASEKVPVFFTGNMSIGINLLCSLAKTAASILGDRFDVEIVEAHHNQKIDAPSGTAKMLADAVMDAEPSEKHLEFDRHARRAKRDPSEIGMPSIRGGTIVGEHQIIFAGQDEIITLSHSARSKSLFATGALSAVEFLVGQKPGLYSMADLIG